MNIFIGNLAPGVTEAEITELFKQYGDVHSVELARVKFSDELRGFGFVDMPGKRHSLAAIAGLNGKDLRGQALTVNEARPKIEHRPRRR